MATENLHIRVSQSGARQSTKSMVGLASAMALVGYAAVRMGKAVVKAADTMTTLGNQTKVFSKDQADANYRMDQTVRIAREMNQSLSTVGQVMQRVSLAQESAGISTQQVVQVVENLSKAVALSGATAQEAEGALRQFAQGLAANRLSGQELNSVLEQTPLVAAVLADALGEPVGALRKMGEAGLLTTKVLVDVFGKEIPKLTELMDKFIFPISSLFASVEREATMFAASMFNLSGGAGVLRGATEGLIRTFTGWNELLLEGGPAADQMARAMKAMGVALGGLAAAATGAIAVKALVFLFGALGTPVLAVVAAVTAAAAAFVYFKDSTFSLGGQVVSLSGLLSAAGDAIVYFYEGTVNVAKAIGSYLANAFTQAKTAAMAFIEPFNQALGWMIGKVQDVTNYLKNMYNTFSFLIPGAEKIDMLGESFNSAGNYVSAMGDNLAAVGSGIADYFDVDPIDRFLARAAEASAAAKVGGEKRESIGAPGGDAKVATGDTAKTADNYLKLAEELNPLLALQNEYAANINTIGAAKLAGLATDAEVLTMTQQVTEAYRQQMDELNFDKFTDIAAMQAGATKGFQDFFKGLGSEAQIWAEGVEGSFNLASDALTEFATTGQLDLKKFAMSVVQHLQKVILKLLLVKALEAATSSFGGAGGGAGGGGGITGFLGSIGGFLKGERATGGPVSGNKPYLVGEKGPELFVPPSSGSIKNATATAGMAPQNNITVVNVDDPSAVPSAMATEAGEEVILNVIARNPDVLREL